MKSRGPTDEQWLAMGWTLLAALALTLGAWLAFETTTDVVVCGRKLVEVPEPAGWRAWPVVPMAGRPDSRPSPYGGSGLVDQNNFGNYYIGGDERCGRGGGCERWNTDFRDDTLCPRAGVSLDDWFVRHSDTYRTDSDIALRESDGTFVVAAHW